MAKPSSPLISQQDISTALGPLASLFPHSNLNAIQSACFHTLLYTDINMVIAAPTGSGKTLLMELALVRLFAPRLVNSSVQTGKAVYISPVKALAHEKATSWEGKFGRLGLNVLLETGDTMDALDSDPHRISSADILVTTPERWDSITRSWKEGMALNLVTSVSLVLIDEVHTVNDERGAVLEALVSRMKTIHKVRMQQANERHPTNQILMRLIAVSGTMSNPEDIAVWLDVPPEGLKIFSDSMRPIALTTKVISYTSTSRNPFGFDRLLCFKLVSLVNQYSDGKPSLIFCPSRKETENAALAIIKETSYVPFDSSQRMRLAQAAQKCDNAVLRQCMEKGVAFHHAAMSINDRRLVEDNFSCQLIRIVCATSTLAVGVNLPARLVIVKGTSSFKEGARVDLPLSDVAQMIGRAGRPGFDTQGVAVILTTEDKSFQYMQLTKAGGAQGEHLESRLHLHLPEHVNADIVLLTISSSETAHEWIRTTFFWIRIQKNPLHYGVKQKDPKAIQEFVNTLIDEQIMQLQALQCVERSGNVIKPTRLGRMMAKYYTYVNTMKILTEELNSHSDLRAILCCVCKTEEFQEFRIRQGDKQHLNPQNKATRFPLLGQKGREIKEDWQKIFILIQLRMSHDNNEGVEEWSLKNESTRIWSALPRVLRLMQEFCVEKNYFYASKNAWLLLRCVMARMWEDSPFLTRQLEGIGEVISQHFARNGIHTYHDILKKDPRYLESITGRHPPFGDEVQNKARSMPIYTMQITQDDTVGLTAGEVSLRVVLTRNFANNVSFRFVWYTLIAGISSGEIVFHRRFRGHLQDSAQVEYTFKLPKVSEQACEVVVALINESVLGLDGIITFDPFPNQTRPCAPVTATKPNSIQTCIRKKRERETVEVAPPEAATEVNGEDAADETTHVSQHQQQPPTIDVTPEPVPQERVKVKEPNSPEAIDPLIEVRQQQQQLCTAARALPRPTMTGAAIANATAKAIFSLPCSGAPLMTPSPLTPSIPETIPYQSQLPKLSIPTFSTRPMNRYGPTVATPYNVMAVSSASTFQSTSNYLASAKLNEYSSVVNSAKTSNQTAHFEPTRTQPPGPGKFAAPSHSTNLLSL
eukprot:PhF_6_TR36499/c0_g1_i1/m.53673/K15271/HFM1, MER3; ATP-dependent DNA helicase HFM1/MER3